MQKKLIVVALSAAFALPVAAHAENGNFTFYGVADLSYDFVNTGDGTTKAVTTTDPTGSGAVSGTSKRVVSSNVSKFGFKGTEDLGDGLSANWQVEQQINIDDAAKNTFASRNTFVNLKSEKFGAVLFGTNDTPYKFASRKLDMFGDNVGDNRALMGNKSNKGFELRPNNILMYTSPTFSGFNAAIATVNLQEANIKSADKNDSLTSLAVMYDLAPFYGSIAHEAHKLESNVTSLNLTRGQDESATRVGFAFRPEDKPFEVTAMYEKTTDNLGDAGADVYGHNAFFLGAKYNIGNDSIKLGYVKAGNLSTGAVTAQTTKPAGVSAAGVAFAETTTAGATSSIADTGANQISIGYDHGLSKRTKLYALYTKITNGKGINYGFSQSSGAASTTSGFGTSPSVVSLGVKHTF